MPSITMRLSRSILVSIHCFGSSRGSSSRYSGRGLFVAGQFRCAPVAVALEQHEGDHAEKREDKISNRHRGLGLDRQGIDAAIAEQRGEDKTDAAGEPADDPAMSMETAEGIGEQVVKDKARAYVEHHHKDKQCIQI